MGILSQRYTDGADDLTIDFHFPTSKKALIIFTRNPELGQCKTRLAKTIGDENALEVYKILLNHTASIAKEVHADRYVFYSEHIIKDDLWDGVTFRKKLQKGDDLGERMQNAFTEILDLGYEKVVIIGSDLLDLDAEVVNLAFSQLDFNDVVFGPAMDGGYYLLGMKNLFPKLFKNKTWSTDTVLESSLKDLLKNRVYLLKTLNDIDTFEDLLAYDQLKPFIS